MSYFPDNHSDVIDGTKLSPEAKEEQDRSIVDKLVAESITVSQHSLLEKLFHEYSSQEHKKENIYHFLKDKKNELLLTAS